VYIRQLILGAALGAALSSSLIALADEVRGDGNELKRYIDDPNPS